ncbi:MFS transporter [Actinomadura algeriensis]|uniref:DHA2 family lincomycin resistance protein-like MFS transporter n=1 Tax=Actinomadura algeriensis TaxID=1679523 RepID=A0ABR9JQ64_9ACTN|nr:MFS transporter [Actinomadura algeriensis]MBE1532719.1 DHA2 family lincomycin resistance protein-like MFS transporter [Actinomadura algeriensis]
MNVSRSASRRALPEPGAASRWKALTVLSLLQCLIAVDVTVVNVALPSIGADLAAGPAELAWVVTGYALVGGGLLLLGGRIADLFGRRRAFLTGAALFGLSSLLAGAAPDLPTLVVARFGQGAGEALASPAAMSLIALLFTEPAERARALGVWGAISGLGMAGGVLLSGVLTELLHWRWIFLVNLPVTVAVLALAPRFVGRDRAPERGGGLDVPGAVLLTAGPLALVFGVLRAAHRPWDDPAVAGPVLAGLASLAAFALVERRSRRPLVPPSFFADRTRTVANAATVLLSAAFSTTFFIVTLYLQDVLALSPLETGLSWLPFCAVLLAALLLTEKVIARVGVKGTALAGAAATAAGAGLLSRMPVGGSLWTDVLPGLIAMAVGMALGLIALQNAALHGVTEQDAGIASGVQRSVDQLGGALGLAVLVGAATAVAARAPGDLAAQVDGFQTAFRYAVVAVLVAAAGFAALARTPRQD